jgi:hypothetical protein
VRPYAPSAAVGCQGDRRTGSAAGRVSGRGILSDRPLTWRPDRIRVSASSAVQASVARCHTRPGAKPPRRAFWPVRGRRAGAWAGALGSAPRRPDPLAQPRHAGASVSIHHGEPPPWQRVVLYASPAGFTLRSGITSTTSPEYSGWRARRMACQVAVTAIIASGGMASGGAQARGEPGSRCRVGFDPTSSWRRAPRRNALGRSAPRTRLPLLASHGSRDRRSGPSGAHSPLTYGPRPGPFARDSRSWSFAARSPRSAASRSPWC